MGGGAGTGVRRKAISAEKSGGSPLGRGSSSPNGRWGYYRRSASVHPRTSSGRHWPAKKAPSDSCQYGGPDQRFVGPDILQTRGRGAVAERAGSVTEAGGARQGGRCKPPNSSHGGPPGPSGIREEPGPWPVVGGLLLAGRRARPPKASS